MRDSREKLHYGRNLESDELCGGYQITFSYVIFFKYLGFSNICSLCLNFQLFHFSTVFFDIVIAVPSSIQYISCKHAYHKDTRWGSNG